MFKITMDLGKSTADEEYMTIIFRNCSISTIPQRQCSIFCWLSAAGWAALG